MADEGCYSIIVDEVLADDALVSFIVCIDDADSYLSLRRYLAREAAAGEKAIEIVGICSANGRDDLAFQAGLAITSGKYVCLTYASSKYDEGAICDFLRSNPDEGLYCFQPIYINPKGKKVSYFSQAIDGIINCEQAPLRINLCVGSYFIPRSWMGEEFFEFGANNDTAIYGLMDLLHRHGSYALMADRSYYFSKGSFDAYNCQEKYDAEWYTAALTDIIIPFVVERQSKRDVQAMGMFLLSFRYLCNWNNRHIGVLSGAEVRRFFDATGDLLQLIDDDLIMEPSLFGGERLPKYLRFRLLVWKYRRAGVKVDTRVGYTNNNMVVLFNDYIVDYKADIAVAVQAINYQGNSLVLDGTLSYDYCLDKAKLKVFFTMNGTVFPGIGNDIYSLSKFFGVSVNKSLSFQVAFPTSNFGSKTTISAFIEYAGRQYQVPFKFPKIASRLSGKFKRSYWCFGRWALFREGFGRVNELAVCEMSSRMHALYEFRLMMEFWRSFTKRRDKRALKSIGLRILYYATRSYFKGKNVWILYDQLFKGGDNGEYLFKYAVDHADNYSRPYYIINKDAVEYRRLKAAYGNRILAFNSVRCKLMALHAAVIFSTRADVPLFCGIGPALNPYIRDLFNAQIVCLQHGLTIQRIAEYQNRLFDNIRHYFLVSPVEKENVLHRVYGYSDDMLSITGAPRYDGLKSSDERIILIAPTWRRSLTAGTNTKGKRNEYSPTFKSSAYYRIYNELINDRNLIEKARVSRYKIIYLIHPILSPQKIDFLTNDYVEIIPGSEIDYNDLLSRSSLMVTDYSGIQFDFAYMRKPIIYYHPDELPPQYDSNVYDYETKAFGPIVKEHRDLVNELCGYIDSGCNVPDYYLNRINEFFPFADNENSQRTYEEAIRRCMNKDSGQF